MNSFARFKLLEKLFGRREIIQPEILTDERAREILGRYANHVVMYNFDSNKWNRTYYLGHRIMSMGVDCARMKREVERALPQLELAAVVGIAAEQRQIKMFNVFPTPAKIHSGQPMAYATFIVRDKGTGKLKELPQKWIKLSDCAHANYVCEVMPQLLSSIGYSNVPMWLVAWCLDGVKVTLPLIPYTEREKYHKQVRRECLHRIRKR